MSSLRHDLLLLDAMLDKILSLLFQMIQTWTYYYILWWENDPLLDLLNWIIDVRPLYCMRLLHKLELAASKDDAMR